MSHRRMGKKTKQGVIRQASAPQIDPKDLRPVTRGGLEDAFSLLASAPPVTTISVPRYQQLSKHSRST